MQITKTAQPCSDDYGRCEQCTAPQTPLSLVIFLPSNYPWGGFFLTLVFGKKKNHQEITSPSPMHQGEKRDGGM
jgi:hypothetical protein